MLKRLWAAILAAGVLATSAGAADEAVTVKLKKPAKGESVTDTKAEEIDITQTVNGTARPTQEVRTKAEYTDAVVEGDGKGRPTKLDRTYKSMSVSVGGKTDTELSGKTVRIEKGKEKYTYTIDGKPLAEGPAKLLDAEFKKDDPEELMLPTKPVKVGDTWEVPAKAVDKMFGEEFVVDAAKVKATGKLVKVYDKNKAKFGVIEYTIELPVTSISGGGGSADTTAGSKLKVSITLDGCIDGTSYESSSRGTLEGEVGYKVQGMDVTLKLTGKMTSKSEPAKK